MNERRLLLLSNSTNAGEPWLTYPLAEIADLLGPRDLHPVFIPYAAARVPFDAYESMVADRLREVGQTVRSIHRWERPAAAVSEAGAIIVGGGNSFLLLSRLQEHGLVAAVRARVLAGTPYVGWSAGANVACPTIRTTNDMPIVAPRGFEAFGLVSFQINPHYLSVAIEGHAGETRDARIEEFVHFNPSVPVVGLREGSMLRIEGAEVRLRGAKPARLFVSGAQPQEYESGSDLSHLESPPR